VKTVLILFCDLKAHLQEVHLDGAMAAAEGVLELRQTEVEEEMDIEEEPEEVEALLVTDSQVERVVAVHRDTVVLLLGVNNEYCTYT
jgi:predicted NUDIX family phosphoesterase